MAPELAAEEQEVDVEEAPVVGIEIVESLGDSETNSKNFGDYFGFGVLVTLKVLVTFRKKGRNRTLPQAGW